MRDKLDTNFIREHFPALRSDFVFMDNAGGSQVLGSVVNRITEYFKHYNVQLGASYTHSAQAGNELNKVTENLAKLVNAKRPEEIIIGPSSTLLLRILSIVLSRQWKPGDEVIVTNSDHEANVSCWTDLQEQGIVVKTWNVNPDTLEFDLDELENLMTERTKLVAMVHASNILGTINPVRQIADFVHDKGSLICVDGVAFAPHRKVDVQELDVDFYVFSTYKVYGPHQAIMFGKYELLLELEGLNHYFIGKDEVPYKLQPGNINYELTYSLDAIPNYFSEIADHHFPDKKELDFMDKHQMAFKLMADHEEVLANRLLDYLKTKKEITIIGYPDGDQHKRVPTISFVHSKFKSSEVVERIDSFNIGIRFGDFYAKKIIEDLGLVEKDGVIRVSLVHYNTFEEVRELIKAFETIF